MKDIELFHGDCLEVMKNIADGTVDMILCDLPYGTTNLKWDVCIDLEKLWEHYERIIKPNGAILLFAQTPFDKILGASNIKLLKYEWIWEKTQATGHLNSKRMPLKAHENILVFYKKLPIYIPQKTQGHKPVNTYTKTIKNQNKTGIYNFQGKEISGGGATDSYPRSVLKFSSDKQKEAYHPTQKPIAILEYLIKTYTKKGELVLDNCMGSGSTGVAARNTSRKFIGIELEKKYFDIAEKRINGEIVYRKIEEPELNYKLPGF